MRWIVANSLRFRYLVVFAAAALLFIGGARLSNSAVDVFPEFAPPKGEIQTFSLGLSAAAVEELVTVPLEQALNGLPGLDVMRSRSVPDLSDIVLIFETDTDLILARQLVQERAASVYTSLPPGAAPPVIIQPLSSTSRVMKIGISSDQVDMMDLSMIAYWKIRARLLDVPGVANAPIWGERIKMPQGQVDLERMRAYDVSVNAINDGPALMMRVEKLPGANALDVTQGVEAAIEEMRPGLRGIDIDTTIFRPATFVELSIENLTNSLLVGAVLVVIVLLFFLYEGRVPLISAPTIPLSLMASLLVLNLSGVTINVMTLAGLAIAIGAVVDDAIVDVENIVRRLRRLRKEGSTQSTARIVLDASIEVRGAIIYASLIEISALLPVFFLEGLSGAFFKLLATAYVVAGLGSPLISLAVTPAMVLILLSGMSNAPIEQRTSPIIPLLHRGSDWVLARVIPK